MTWGLGAGLRCHATNSMTGERLEFCDTNILVYAHDVTAGAKRSTAVALLDDLCLDDRCRLSPQVLSEFYVNVTRKLPHRLEPAEAFAIVIDLAACVRVPTMAEDVVAAIELARTRQLSLWDALIIRSALRARAAVLWSEDLQDRARYDELEVRNPFI